MAKILRPRTRTDAPIPIPDPEEEAAADRAAAARRADQPPAWLGGSGIDRGPLSAKQDRDRAALAHLSVATGVVGPLVVWLLYRDRGPFTAQESKEALNFAGPATLLVILLFVLGDLPVVGPLIAILGALVWIAMTLYGVLGASQVVKGRPYRYPFNLRILR